jgi:tyrosinase
MFVQRLTLLLLLFAFMRNSHAQPTPQVYPRLDIRTFSKDSIAVEKFRNAVDALQSRNLDNATAWFNMAGIHEFADDESNIPGSIKALFHQCHRRPALFFLWHRAYVFAMERLLQDAIHDPTFRIPYWDWYTDPSIPEMFRNEWLDSEKTKKNPLYVGDRNEGVNAGDPVWTPIVRTKFLNDNFNAFQAQLNGAEHGAIHVAVGTDSNMGHPSTAARDPIFWLHHTNIDRLLPVWLKMGVNHRANTNYPEWKPTDYRFPIPGWTLQQPTTTIPTVADLALNSNQMLGYTYENTDPPAVPRATVPPEPKIVNSASGGPLTMKEGREAVSSRRSVEISDGGTVKLGIKSDAAPKFMALAKPEERKAPPAVSVVLADVALAKLPAGVLSYDVFVNLPKSVKGTENFDEHYLGSISLFELRGQHDKNSGAAHELRFDAKPALAATVKKANAAPSEISVSIVPVLAPKAKKPEETVLKIGEIRLETSAEPR